MKAIKLKHTPGLTRPEGDKRYSIALEFCGYPTARYVVRFCGDWVSSHASEAGAWKGIRRHHVSRGIF